MQPLQFPIFYRRHAARLTTQLAMPPLAPIQKLVLPFGSIYHYLVLDGAELGPPSDDYLFREITKPIQVGHVFELTSHEGNPRRVAVVPTSLIKDYHQQHRRFRLMRSLQVADQDERALIVYNYALLAKGYRYLHSFYSEYYKWYNAFATMVDTIIAATEVSRRNHFIMTGSARVIPSLTQLNTFAQNLTQNAVKVLRDKESYLLLELWKWLSPEHRNQSLLNRIPVDKRHLVNFIYQESGQWVVLNLGQLDAFRRPSAEEQKEIDRAEAAGETVAQPAMKSKDRLQPEQLMKRVLRFYMSVMEARTLANVVKPEDTLLAPTATPAASDPELLVDDQQSGADDEDDDNTSLGNRKEINPAQPVAEPVDEIQQLLQQEDEELTEEERQKRLQIEDEQLDADLAQLNEIAARQEQEREASEASFDEVLFQDEGSDLSTGVMRVCDQLADDGRLSAAEYRRFQALAKSYERIPAPLGVEASLGEFAQVPAETLVIKESNTLPDSPTVVDKSMLKSSLVSFDQRYITDVLERDTAAMALSVQRAGIAVTDYKVEEISDALGTSRQYSVRVVPVVGQPSTLRWKLPVVKEDGIYEAGGVKYRLRKQRGDLPIRKVSPTRVALTSYYGKVFVNRSKKKSDDYSHWLQSRVMEKVLTKDPDFQDVKLANVFDNHLPQPRAYSAMAHFMRSMRLRTMQLIFDHQLVTEVYAPALIEAAKKDGTIIIGSDGESTLTMDKGGTVYARDTQGVMTPLGTLERLMNIPTDRAPVEYATVSVFSKDVPVGVCLAMQMGMEKLIRLLGVEVRRVPAGTRKAVMSHEWGLYFADEILIFPRDHALAAMVMGGFLQYEKALRLFSVYSFDKRGVYLNLLETEGLGARYLREADLMWSMFVDPITRDLLVEMKEPTSFEGLLLRSCQLLLSEEHPAETDSAFMRIKGYERFAGAVYTELVQSLRQHQGRLGRSTASLELNPYAVWKRISEDGAKSQVMDINPIHSLKETEAVTYSGTGGRSRVSMTRNTRAYHENDMGTISGDTVDSGDVGINVFTSADPQFTSLRGMSKRFELGKTGTAALLSTSALMAPGSDHDDPKRVNFVGIQNSHAIACTGYEPFMVRTGYDAMIAHRSHDLFAYTAKKAGKVRSISDKGIVVDYEDGTSQGYELGRRFGQAAGLTLPHDVITDLKEGMSFEVGEPIVYNSGFFQRDFLNPKQLTMKNSITVKTVLWESSQTLEDASVISRRVSEKLRSNITKIKTIMVNFDQNLDRLVKVGDLVTADTVLGIIQNSSTANLKAFDDDSLDTLRVLSAQTPRAGVSGRVEKVEIFYHGDKEDMSDTLRVLANMGDRELRKAAGSTGKAAHTGSVDSGFRIEGDPLPMDSMAIRIYITSEVGAYNGDKGVFANQMKTVFSNVMDEDYTTEDGELIDAIFSTKSINARIVLSPFIIGTTNSLLKEIARQAVEAYENDD